MNYGLPYQGTKRKLASKILDIIPPCENLYDLFGGGGSIAHCAAIEYQHKFKNIHYNEIKTSVFSFFRDTIKGKYNYKNGFIPQWVSREEFMRLKDTDGYIQNCWSFGNNQMTYIYGKLIENEKRSLHNAVVFNDFDDLAKKLTGVDHFDQKTIKERRLFLKKLINGYQLQSLERLESLESLERLESVFNVHFTNLSYDQIAIKQGSVIYCDPPYKGTGKYGKQVFDHDSFFEWVNDSDHIIFFSEYAAPDCFKEVASFNHQVKSGKQNSKIAAEKIFCNKKAQEFIK